MVLYNCIIKQSEHFSYQIMQNNGFMTTNTVTFHSIGVKIHS